MSKKMKTPSIKPLEGYSGMSDTGIVVRGTAIQTGMTGNSKFPNPPVDLAVLKTDIDSLSALMAEALDGSKRVIAQKNKQREAVIKKLRLLGRYVEITSDGDMTAFATSGFLAASTAKTPPAPLPLPVITSVYHGAVSGKIVVQVQKVTRAKSYEIRYGSVVNGAPPSSWTSTAMPGVKPPAGIDGLTPGTLYAFQVRALGKLGWTDWTDSATCMCV
ncbi:MAG TPA: fibronectin type III domain-containing protein [Terriglobia bacterium]